MEYREYLQTPHWQKIKVLMYKKHHGCCQNCGRKTTLDVHHLTYENIGHENLKQLKLLCRDCHYRMHRMKGGIFNWHPNDVIERIIAWFKKNYAIEGREE